MMPRRAASGQAFSRCARPRAYEPRLMRRRLAAACDVWRSWRENRKRHPLRHPVESAGGAGLVAARRIFWAPSLQI